MIRVERPEDCGAIRDLTARAFAPMSFADDNDCLIPEQLRRAGQLTLSLVDDRDRVLVGHVAFSPVQISGATGAWFGLGPISVEPGLQKQGIGTALAADGLTRLRAIGAAGVVLIGNPKVYGPMGFQSTGLLTYRDLEPAYVMGQAFQGDLPAGEITFHAAFR